MQRENKFANTQTHLPCHEITKKTINVYIIHILSQVEDIQNKWIAKQIPVCSVRSRYMEKIYGFFFSHWANEQAWN